MQSELKVAANRRYLCQSNAELEEVFTELESDKKLELPAAAND